MREVVLALMVCAVAGVTPVCAADYADAIKSGDEKNRAREFVGARADYAQALVSGQSSVEKVEARKRIASTYRTQNDLKMAKEEYVQALAIEGLGGAQRAELFLAISDVCQAAQDVDGARAEVMQAMDIKDLPPEWVATVLMRLSDLSSAKNDYASSREALNKGLAVEGISPNRKADLQNRLGNNYLAEKDYAKAKAAFAKVVDMPDVQGDARANAQVMVGAAMQAEGDMKGAVEAYTKVLDFKGTSFWPKFDAISRLAGIYQADKKYAEAKSTLEQAFTLEGIDAERIANAQIMIGAAEQAGGNTKGALETYTKVLDLTGTSFWPKLDALRRMAGLYQADKKLAEAKSTLERAFALEGIDAERIAETHQGLADLCIQVQDWPGAQAALAKAMAGKGIGLETRANIMKRNADTLWWDKKGDAAVAQLNKIVADPAMPPNQKADAQKRIDEYLAQSGRIVEGPSKAELQSRLANACTAKNDYAGAKAALAKIADMTDANGEARANALIRLGSIYRLEKKFPEARTEFGKVLTMTDVSPDAKLWAQLNIINAYKDEPNSVRAREETQKLLEMPNVPAVWRDQARKYLDETK